MAHTDNIATGPAEARRAVPGGVPPVAVVVAVVSLILGVCATLVGLALAGELDETSTPLVVSLIGIVVTTVPAVLGMAYSERVSRDVRNGVLVKQTKEGAAQAIAEQQVMTRTGPVATAELAALTHLLQEVRRHPTDAPQTPPPAEPI